MTTGKRTPYGRSAALSDGLVGAADPSAVTIDLPPQVTGDVAFTFMQVLSEDEDAQAWDVAFDWDGSSRRATFVLDISEDEDQSPLSSSPIHGWVSWELSPALLVAFSSPDQEWDGWFRLPDGSPLNGGNEDADDEEVLGDPGRWVELARRVNLAIIELDNDDGAVTGGSYHA